MNVFRIAAAGAVALVAVSAGAAPQYTIVDLGVLAGTTASQGFGVSPDGGTAVGRSVGTQQIAYAWSAGTGMVGLPNLSGRTFAVANDVNASGVVVGTSTTTSFGSGALPVLWSGGVITALPLPAGQTVGRAEAVNASGLVAGSIGGGISQRGALFTSGSVSVIDATTANGSYMTTAYGINDGGLVTGSGVDPNNAALNVGLVYDSHSGTMISIGALPGLNGALPFDISESGYVVGSSMLNQGAGTPFIWSAAGGMVAIPLPAGTSQGSARGVNDGGWVVGIASSAFAVPFLYDGSATYTLESLLPANSGWTFNNTSNAAYAITNDGTIVGTSVFNGQTHAFMMQLAPVPEPGGWVLMLAGLAFTAGVLRRRHNQ